MIFGEFRKVSIFIEKEKKRKKWEKNLAWSSPQQSRPNCKDSAHVEKRRPPGEAHSDLDILH
jgi:hypothetical protein